MDIIVCTKRVPFTQEVDLEIDVSKRDIVREGLSFVPNDWDNYAMEEAILLKEQLGGEVTAITVGTEEDEEVLRRALAMGADRAIRVEPGALDLDSRGIAKILSRVIGGLQFDLILTGVQADDTNEGSVGVMLAEELGLGHVTVVNALKVLGDRLEVGIELEGGTEEVALISLPALLTVQTGINEPRYVSVMGIRKAGKKELKVVRIEDLGLSPEELAPDALVEELYMPQETGGAEMLTGDPGTLAEKIIKILKEKGVVQ